MANGSKTIEDLEKVNILDDKDEFLFFQNSTKKTKRITKGNMANSGGGLRGKFIDAATGNDVGITAAAATVSAQLATASAEGAQASANGKNKIYYLDNQPVNGVVVGSISGTTLTVSSVTTPVFTGGQYIYIGAVLSWTGGSGGSSNIRVTGQLTGTTGGVGTYSISATASASSSTTITANPFSTGDIWFETDQGYKTYKYGVSSWAAYESDGDQVLSGLNVGKLTAGYISGKAIELSDSTAYIQSSTFIETWTATRTFTNYNSRVGGKKANVSNQDLCKVLQTDGTYKIFKSVQTANINQTPPASGNNSYWEELTASTTPTLDSVAPNITLNLSPTLTTTFRDLGFRIVGSGSAEFASSIFRGVIVAKEGFFGSSENAALIDTNGLVIGSTGRIKSSSVSWSGAGTGTFSGNGFFLGYTGGQYQFYIGDASTNYLRWDGSALKINGNLLSGTTLGTNGDTGFGLVLQSNFGIRRSTNAGIITITAGTSNGANNGAQLELHGNDSASNEGLVTLQAGTGSVSAIRLFTNTGASSNIGTLRFDIDTYGTVGIPRAMSGGTTYTDDGTSGGAGCLEIDGNVGIGRISERTTVAQGKLWVANEVAVYGASNARNIILTGSSGDVTAVSFTTSSSKKFKTNIKQLNSGIETIDKLKPVSFKRKGTKQQDIGLIAEEVDKILPVIVKHNDKNEAEGLDYSKLTVVLINAVKELSAEVKELKKKLKNANSN